MPIQSALLTVLALTLGTARADDAGDAWLQKVDAAAQVGDIHLVLDVAVHDKKGERGRRTLQIWQKGDERRLIQITAPSRLAGTGLLVTHSDVIHLFLPAYPPARRVTGQGRADAFLGTDFALEDLSRITYAADYTATVGAPDGDLTRLDLTPREGDGAVRLWVGADAVVRRIEHDDRKGKTVRRLQLDDVRPEGRLNLAHTVQVEDLSRGRRTVATVQTATVEGGIDDEVFTVTNLERR
jgi:hypothetical protein